MGGKWIADGPCLPMKTGSANGGTDSHQAWKTDFSVLSLFPGNVGGVDSRALSESLMDVMKVMVVLIGPGAPVYKTHHIKREGSRQPEGSSYQLAQAGIEEL